MTGSRPDPHLPDDLDPTGVRALLANLPDPAPMPEDLVARISQSLALEQQRRATGSSEGTAHPFGAPSGRAEDSDAGTGQSIHHSAGGETERTPDGVISLAAERQRRRPGRTVIWLGGAAAVAMVATFSANQLLDDGSDSNLSAAVPGAHEAAEDGAEAGGVTEPGRAEGETDPSDAAGDDSAGSGQGSDGLGGEAPAASTDDGVDGGDTDSSVAAMLLTAGGTVTLSDSNLDDQVSDWVATTPALGTGTWSAQQAADCIADQGLQIASADQVMVSDATWQGEPAMLVVAAHAEGGSAWVLTADCDEIVTGPVTFP